ncbi:hypothetical protein D3C71_1396760 [compost metagenome]
MHMAHGGAQHAGGVEHAFGIPDRDGLAGFAVFDLFGLQDLAHGLGDRQVSGRQQHHEAVPRFFIDHHLSERADLIEAGVGTRVGQENQPGVEFDGDAIRHERGGVVEGGEPASLVRQTAQPVCEGHGCPGAELALYTP